MDFSFDIPTALGFVLAVPTLWVAIRDMRRNNREAAALEAERERRTRERERNQIRGFMLNWEIGKPNGEEPEGAKSKNVYGLRISNYSDTMFRDLSIEASDKKGPYKFFQLAVRPGDYFLQFYNVEHPAIKEVENLPYQFEELHSLKGRGTAEGFSFTATCKDMNGETWRIDSKAHEWEKCS